MRFLIVDDHQIVREGLCALLAQHYPTSVIDQRETAVDLIAVLANDEPDILILDLKMPGVDGLDILQQMRQRFADISVIILSGYVDNGHVREAISAGANAFVVKDAGFDEVLAAIRAILKHEMYLSPRLMTVLVDQVAKASAKSDSLETLTAREQQVFRMVATGLSSKQIAAELDLSVKTIDANRKNIMTKLSFNSVVDWVKYAIKIGVIELE